MCVCVYVYVYVFTMCIQYWLKTLIITYMCIYCICMNVPSNQTSRYKMFLLNTYELQVILYV